MNIDGSKTSPGSNGAAEETPLAENALAYRSIRNVFLERFPELWDRIEKKYASHYDLKTQIPGTYPLFEEILKPRVLELLDSGADDDSLKRIFSFYEEMACSQDEEVANLLRKSILEPLASDEKLIASAWKYMGEKTGDTARQITKSRGQENNLPADGYA
jgi:hypothetical protein